MKYWTLSPSNQFSSPLSLLLSPFWSCYKNWTIAKMQELGYSHTNAEWKKPVLKSTCYITPFIWKKWSEVKWSCSVCPTLCDPIDCSPPGSSVREILQTRVLEWVAISFPGLLHCSQMLLPSEPLKWSIIIKVIILVSFGDHWLREDKMELSGHWKYYFNVVSD